jgi:D-arabinose 1-dehydrogenase
MNTGLPVRLLVELAEVVRDELKRPLDVVLSYSHLTLQNSALLEMVPRFHAAGVKTVLTASPLSMGLLRAQGPHPWHPATQALKDAVIKANKYIESRGHDMADTSMRYVFSKWNGTVVGGWSSVKELEDAVTMWHHVEKGIGGTEDEMLWAKAREIMGDEVDAMWDSPEKGWVYRDGTKVE